MLSPSESESDDYWSDDVDEEGDDNKQEEEDNEDGELPPAIAIFLFSLEPCTLT